METRTKAVNRQHEWDAQRSGFPARREGRHAWLPSALGGVQGAGPTHRVDGSGDRSPLLQGPPQLTDPTPSDPDTDAGVYLHPESGVWVKI